MVEVEPCQVEQCQLGPCHLQQGRLDAADGPTRGLEQRDEPLVIRAGAASWPAVERWSPEYLARRLGPIEIAYKVSSSNAHPDFRATGLGAMFARQRAPLERFLALIGSGRASERARYLFTGDEQFLLRRRAGQTSIDPELAPLLADLETPALFPEDRLYTMWAWLSGPGVRTWLHYDNNGCHNLNAQIRGRKRCVLYAPQELAKLHPFPLGGGNPAHNCSRIDVERPDAELRVDASVRAWHAELEAGDLLFIPAWWFHTFEHLGEFNANVNYWWKPAAPIWNVVAARQAVIDAVAAAKLDTSDPVIARALSAIDAAAVQREP
jgi:lysine-specific demethylase 8